jgi:hypothetical protein
MINELDGGEEARWVLGIDIFFALRLEPEIPKGLAEFQQAGVEGKHTELVIPFPAQRYVSRREGHMKMKRREAVEDVAIALQEALDVDPSMCF